eukprot:SAG11_NODE_160_length_14023_cov_23.003017_9_plen_324_part_00
MPTEEAAKWSCPECVNGTKPTIDDIVWAKVGNYRWWPAQIRERKELPEQLRNKTVEAGQFAVYYFGTGEWGFMSHAKTICWERGDERHRFSKGSGMQKQFKEAVTAATAAFEERFDNILKEKAELKQDVKIKPNSFKRTATNKYNAQTKQSAAELKEARADLQECACTGEHPCDSDDCLNRCMYIECTKHCPAGVACQNQRFQRRATPQGLESYKTGDKGFGLRCKERLLPGVSAVLYLLCYTYGNIAQREGAGIVLRLYNSRVVTLAKQWHTYHANKPFASASAGLRDGILRRSDNCRRVRRATGAAGEAGHRRLLYDLTRR